ncbi:MAG: saccharopine dehydrogenase NADP-binding domain-containing protein [Elusimicrobia bacterium]|nr:saccharopine dehydrogenase NADP-binding domain-containing protein [Elusimicrobiota bacterium]
MKVAVLGGFGLMAEAALHDLAADRRVTQVLAADMNLARAKAVLALIPNRKKIRPLKVDITKTAAAARALKGTDSVLNAAWYEFNLKAMDLSLALKAHYADLGGLYHMTLKQLKRDAEFRKAGLLACLGCGSTPGITNMMVARMSGGFETLDTVGIYDAGFDPSLSEESFLPPFSIRTMLAEYEAPAPILWKGRMVDVPAHSQPEGLDFKEPIGRVTAGTVIHSETATLPAYLKDKGVKNLFFKIVYPESVKRQLGMLVGMGLSQDKPVRVNGYEISPRHFVTALAQQSAVKASQRSFASPQDFEVLRVRLSGTRHKKPLIKVWDCEIRPTKLISAGALGVGFTGAIVSVMLGHRKSQVSAGAGAPESILDPDVFFRELKARKVFSIVETIAHPLAI